MTEKMQEKQLCKTEADTGEHKWQVNRLERQWSTKEIPKTDACYI